MRKLTLKKETVAELTRGELTSVVGAGYTMKLCISGIQQCVPTLECSYDDGCLTPYCTTR